MFRGLRHTLAVVVQLGIIASALIALAVQPTAWLAVLISAGGASIVAFFCVLYARNHLRQSLGALRRAADDLGHGRAIEPIDTRPTDDFHKLVSAINLVATRLIAADHDREALHQKLRRTERLAFLGELAANVAHEVNNPLDGVQNCTRILRRSMDDPQRAAQMLDLMESGLRRIELIVRRLLTLARENVIRPSEARVSAVVTRALRDASERLAARSIRVATQFIEDDVAMVDLLLLEHAFLNLITNAVDSMSDGGELAIRTFRAGDARDGAPVVDPAGRFICVEFADEGGGIPADVLPHIFEPFFTTKPDGKGTGLGLPIAARIVDAHGGTILVAPRSSGGTSFFVEIPISDPAAVARQPTTRRASAIAEARA